MDPECDECGVLMEEAEEWCGTCGNCREHCERYYDCPPKVGDRVEAVKFSVSGPDDHDDNLLVPPGTRGTVTHIDDGRTVHVKWDNGRNLGLLETDEWLYAPPEPPTISEVI